MKVIIMVFVALFFLACDSGSNYSTWYSEPEYTGEDGEIGGRCILPRRTCNCYPECYCEGDNLKCTPMPDHALPEADDSDSLLEDDTPGPPDGWGGQE